MATLPITASRAALTSSLNISFFVQPTEESLNGFPDRRNGMRIKVISGLASLFFFFRSPFDGLDGSIELIGLVASLPLPVVTAPAIAPCQRYPWRPCRYGFFRSM